MKTADIIASKNKSQDAEAILTPTNAKLPVLYIGCLEYRYIPLVTGSLLTEVVAKFAQAIQYNISPNKVIGRPI